MGLKATLIAFSAASSTQGFRQTPTYRSNNCDDGRAAYSTRSSNARTSAILAKEKLFCTTYCSERRVFADNGAHGGSRGSNNHRRSSYFFLQMTADTDETTSSTTPDVPTPSPKAGENVMVDRGRKGVSRALNRALGRILSTGDMFGGVGEKGVSDDASFGKVFTTPISAVEERNDEEEGEEKGKALDVKDYFGKGYRPPWRSLGQKESTNRLLRVKSKASAAVVVDGPFSKLQQYMTLPVSEYSLLDSSLIRRVTDTSFRFQIPLKDLVGLDFTPTMEVEVKLDPNTKAVVFRSTRSTLYGNVGKPGEEASTNPWPAAASSKVEYFRVGFDARLWWADGDASETRLQLRRRGGFTGEFTRRPRSASHLSSTPFSKDPNFDVGKRDGNGVMPTAEIVARTAAGAPVAPAASATAVTTVGGGGTEALESVRPPATVFCETKVKVQVLLPPPYDTVLPWQLVRALLGKVLSTIVGFVLPRFLELLADDFYSWQSGNRQAAATAVETSRTLLGTKNGSRSSTARGEGKEGQERGFDEQERRRREEQQSGPFQGNTNNNSVNPVIGGFRRLRNVRGFGGGGSRRGTTEEGARSPSAAAQPTTVDRASLKVLQDWAMDEDGVSPSTDMNTRKSEDEDDNGDVGGEEKRDGEKEPVMEGEKQENNGRSTLDRRRQWGGWGGGGGPMNWWG